MPARHRLSRDDRLLVPLLRVKRKNLRFLRGALRLCQGSELLQIADLMSMQQLDFAADNMIRILMLGSMKPGMEDLFAEQVEKMESQRVDLRRRLVELIPPLHRGDLLESVEEVVLAPDEELRGAIDMIRQDFEEEVVCTEEAILVGEIGEAGGQGEEPDPGGS